MSIERLAGWQWASGQGRERTNREAVEVWEPGPTDDPSKIPAIAVLANGVGTEGSAAAEAAAKAACEMLAGKPWADMPATLRAAADAANEAIRNGKADKSIGENGAAGLLLVAMKDDAVTWWGAGNSTLLRLRLRETLAMINQPAGTTISPQTPSMVLMGMPYGDPDQPNDGADTPESAAVLMPGDLIIATTAGITTLTEEKTERILRDAVAQDGNRAEEVLRAAMLTTPPALHNLSVATRRATEQERRKRKLRKDRTISARIDNGEVIVTVDGKHLNPRTSQRLKNLSSEFGWGYRGNGAQQLAFAILYTITRNLDEAERHYTKFYEERIARMLGRSWSIESDDVRSWIKEEVAREAAELQKAKDQAAADEEARRAEASTAKAQQEAAERVAAEEQTAERDKAQEKAAEVAERLAKEEQAAKTEKAQRKATKKAAGDAGNHKT